MLALSTSDHAKAFGLGSDSFGVLPFNACLVRARTEALNPRIT